MLKPINSDELTECLKRVKNSLDLEREEKLNVQKLENYFNEAKAELNVDLPNDYANILVLVNGLEFNGFILYGIDESLLNKQPNQSINGLIEYNKIWYENEWQKKYIFIGESNISWYVYDFAECKYVELDNPSGRENEVFSSLEYMVEKILSDALA